MSLKSLFERIIDGGYGPHVKIRPNGSRYVDADEHFRDNEEWMEKVSQLGSLFKKDAEEKTTETREVR